MIATGVKEKRNGEVILNGYSTELLDAFLHVIYNRKFERIADHLPGLAEMFDVYQVGDVGRFFSTGIFCNFDNSGKLRRNPIRRDQAPPSESSSDCAEIFHGKQGARACNCRLHRGEETGIMDESGLDIMVTFLNEK